MSSISISEAQSFSVQDKPDRYYYSGRIVDQLFDVLPLEPIDGHGKLLTLAPHADLPNHAAVIGFGGQGVPATRPTTQQQAHSFSHYAARVEIDSLVAGQYSSTHDVVKAELDLKAAAILALYRQHLIRGDSGSSGEFDGLIQLQQETFEADDGNPNGGVVQPGEIEKVIASLSMSRGRYLVMASDAFHHLYRNNYAHQIYTVEHQLLGALPAISGAPILLNDYIPTDQAKGTSSNTTTVFGVVLGREHGLCGLVPARNRGQEIQVRGPYALESTDTAVFELTAQFGLGLYGGVAVAALDGVDWQQ